jgi:hypothetical protein
MQMRLFILLCLVIFNLQLSTVYARSQFTLPTVKYALTVKTTPSTAVVKIMNIRPSYYDGIKLKSGNYRIEVSARGYDTQKKTVAFSNKDKVIYIALSKKVALTPKNPPAKEEPQTAENSIAFLPDNTPIQQEKPKFTHTKGYSRFLRRSNELYGISYQDPLFNAYCRRYARLAVRQAKRRIRHHCEGEISILHNDAASQWQLVTAPQKAWCKTVSSHATYKETIYREERLEYCVSGYILRSK